MSPLKPEQATLSDQYFLSGRGVQLFADRNQQLKPDRQDFFVFRRDHVSEFGAGKALCFIHQRMAREAEETGLGPQPGSAYKTEDQNGQEGQIPLPVQQGHEEKQQHNKLYERDN